MKVLYKCYKHLLLSSPWLDRISSGGKTAGNTHRKLFSVYLFGWISYGSVNQRLSCSPLDAALFTTRELLVGGPISAIRHSRWLWSQALVGSLGTAWPQQVKLANHLSGQAKPHLEPQCGLCGCSVSCYNVLSDAFVTHRQLSENQHQHHSSPTTLCRSSHWLLVCTWPNLSS